MIYQTANEGVAIGQLLVHMPTNLTLLDLIAIQQLHMAGIAIQQLHMAGIGIQIAIE